MRHVRMVLLCVIAGCGSDGRVTWSEDASVSPATATPAVSEKIAACDGAHDGTPCGEAYENRHCLYNACVRDACGDGIRGRYEECDDGDQNSGDGCSAACLKEACGNGRVDLGEQCDDQTSTCQNCLRTQASGAAMDAGGLDAGHAGDGCFDSDAFEVVATPTSVLEGETVRLQLQPRKLLDAGLTVDGSVLDAGAIVEARPDAGAQDPITGADYAWIGKAVGHGSWARYTCKAKDFATQLDLWVVVSQLGTRCAPAKYDVNVSCLPVPDGGS